MVLCCLFLLSAFRWRFPLCLFKVVVVRFGLLSVSLLGKSCLTICYLCVLAVCDFRFFPFRFWGMGLGSDCPSSCSLHDCYICVSNIQKLSTASRRKGFDSSFRFCCLVQLSHANMKVDKDELCISLALDAS